MKKSFYFITLLFALPSINGYSQTPDNTIVSKVAMDSLHGRITELQKLIKEQNESQKLAEAKLKETTNDAYTDQFMNASQAIQTGLETGGSIELIVPGTLRLLSLKDLNETLNAINNPTSNSIGQPFSQMVINSATTHLLPTFPNDNLKAQATTKFKNVLESIYKGPIVQALINSNPISSTINAAIQQAGFFEKPRLSNVELSKHQLKDVKPASPLKFAVNTENLEGASFTSTEMDAFNSDLQKRIEFYSAINQYGIQQNEITQQLYVDAKLIKRSVKASKSEICKLLKIDPDNASAEFNNKFTNLTMEQIKSFLKDANFKKAVSLSDYAKEQLPEVKEFNTTVINALVTYIDGYINILNQYKDIKEANLDAAQIADQVKKLTSIKANLKSPV